MHGLPVFQGQQVSNLAVRPVHTVGSAPLPYGNLDICQVKVTLRGGALISEPPVEILATPLFQQTAPGDEMQLYRNQLPGRLLRRAGQPQPTFTSRTGTVRVLLYGTLLFFPAS